MTARVKKKYIYISIATLRLRRENNRSHQRQLNDKSDKFINLNSTFNWSCRALVFLANAEPTASLFGLTRPEAGTQNISAAHVLCSHHKLLTEIWHI